MRTEALVVGAALAAGCTGPATFVGGVAETDAMVGLAIDGDAARLYLCGGPESQDVHHHWFELAPSDDGWTGEATVDERALELVGTRRDGYDGTVLDAGEEIATFRLDPATADEGPWHAEGPLEGGCVAGAVVHTGGEGLQGVFYCPPEPDTAPSLTAQVVPVGVIRAGEGRIEVQVADDADTTFAIVPARP